MELPWREALNDRSHRGVRSFIQKRFARDTLLHMESEQVSRLARSPAAGQRQSLQNVTICHAPHHSPVIQRPPPVSDLDDVAQCMGWAAEVAQRENGYE